MHNNSLEEHSWVGSEEIEEESIRTWVCEGYLEGILEHFGYV